MCRIFSCDPVVCHTVGCPLLNLEELHLTHCLKKAQKNPERLQPSQATSTTRKVV